MAINRYVLTSTITIPYPATWAEVINEAANAVVTTPAVPASATAQENNNPFPVLVTVTGGTVSAISVGGISTGLTTGGIVVPSASSITLTYTVAPTWAWTTIPGASSGQGATAQVAAVAPAGGQAGVIPQTTFIKGTAIEADPAGALFAAIGAGNLRAYVQGQDDVGHAGLSN